MVKFKKIGSGSTRQQQNRKLKQVLKKENIEYIKKSQKSSDKKNK